MKSIIQFKKRLNNHLSNRFKSSIKIDICNESPKSYIETDNYFSYSDNYFSYIGDPPFWTLFKKIKLKQLFIQRLNDVDVIGKGIIIDNNGYINLESTISQEEYLVKLKSNHLIKFRKLIPYKKISKAIVLSNYLYGNYYHWITENLGRLTLLDEQKLNDYIFILNADAPKFTRESLIDLFNIHPSKIYTNYGKRLKISQVLLPSFPITKNQKTKWTNIYDPEVIRRINSISKTKTHLSKVKRNFLISRDNATQRRILNADLILTEFASLELEIIVLEDLTFLEQMSLFRNAGIIIATHGAGLANLVFCEKPLVIELFPSNRYNRDAIYFYQITNALAIEHHIIEYEAENKRQDILINFKITNTINNILKVLFS